MIATKIGFFAFRVHFGPLKLRYSHFLFYTFFSQNCMILMFYILGIGQNVDIYPSKRLWKLSVTKIGLSFSKPILSPLELTILCQFLHNHGQN